jgi:alanyl-tRNA synthetase
LFTAAGVSADQVDLDTEQRGAEIGSQGARINFYGKKNWWCRGGRAESMPVGEPGGPDSEMFYLYPQIEHDPAYGTHCHPNCDCGRYIELGNSVFMEYKRTETGFEPLPRRNVDYGGGLARIAAASMDSPDVYRINLLWPIVAKLEELSGRSYETDTEAMRVIADHLRGATFLAVDGVKPSNKEQGYVMRRLLRRAVRYAFDLGLQENFFPDIIPTVSGIYTDDYPEVAERSDTVVAVLVKEEKAFRRTLNKGIKQLRAYRDGIGGAELFVLYDTFGFPVELSTEEARRRDIPLSDGWRAQFDARMAEQRARSQAATRMKIA